MFLYLFTALFDSDLSPFIQEQTISVIIQEVYDSQIVVQVQEMRTYVRKSNNPLMSQSGMNIEVTLIAEI